MSLFSDVLGVHWDALARTIQDTHISDSSLTLKGRSSVTRGPSVFAKMIGFVFRFPAANEDISLTVTKQKTSDGEIWTRTFGDKRLVSYLSHAPNGLCEKFGFVQFDIALNVKDGVLHYPVSQARIGPLVLPKILLPISVATEQVIDGKFWFDVAVYAPFTKALIVHYRGWLVPK